MAKVVGTKNNDTIFTGGVSSHFDHTIGNSEFIETEYKSTTTIDAGVSAEASSELKDEDDPIELFALPGENIDGSSADEIFYPGGITGGHVGIESNGGSDRLVLDSDDVHSFNQANLINARLMVRDFRIDDVSQNDQADILDIGGFLEGKNLTAKTVGDYLHVVSDARYASSVIYVNKEGDFTEENRDLLTAFETQDYNIFHENRDVKTGADLKVEFYDWAKRRESSVGSDHVNFEELTGYPDNTVEQFQALIDLGFLDLSGSYDQPVVTEVTGTEQADNLEGDSNDNIILSNGLETGIESIRGNGGTDTLLLDADDKHANNQANNINAHFRIRDFTIASTSENEEADVLDIGNFLNGVKEDGSNLTDYFHIISGVFGDQRTVVFVDKDGQFTDEKRIALSNDVRSGGHGSDLMLEFQGHEANNNFATLTGEADNTVEQLQALIDMGFLKGLPDIEPGSDRSDANRIELSVDSSISLNGTHSEDVFVFDDQVAQWVGGFNADHFGLDGRGGSDSLVIESGINSNKDNAGNRVGHIRLRNFTVDNVAQNAEADVIDLRALFEGVDITADNLGNYIHIVDMSWQSLYSGIYINEDGDFTAEDKAAFDTASYTTHGHGADIFIENQTLFNNLEDITGYENNSVEQYQALLDMGFLLVSDDQLPESDNTNSDKNLILGNNITDSIVGSDQDDTILPGNVSTTMSENIYSNGGADTLVFDKVYSTAENDAKIGSGHFRIKDFTIADVNTHEEADVLDLTGLLENVQQNGSNLTDYFHIISGAFGDARTVVFVDKDGQFTDEKRIALSNDVRSGGHGSDLMLEFQGHEANNNFATLTGEADNTVEQLQALLNMGFLKVGDLVTVTASDDSPNIILGSDTHWKIVGSEESDTILPGNITANLSESVYSNGGADTLVFDKAYSTAENNAGIGNGHFRIKDFTIADVDANEEADALDLTGLLENVQQDGSNLTDYFHIISGVFGDQRTVVFVDKDGQFTDEKRMALSNDVRSGGHGADLMLEFQGHQANNNFITLTGEADNTVEQLQALIDMGFLKGLPDIAPASDTSDANRIELSKSGSYWSGYVDGTEGDDAFIFNDRTSGWTGEHNGASDHFRLNGQGSDSLVIQSGLNSNRDNAGNTVGHIRLKEFTVDSVKQNAEADVIDLRALFEGVDITAENFGNYIHIVDMFFGPDYSGIYINEDGDFTAEDKAALDPPLFTRPTNGYGSDIFIENQTRGNNLEDITGYENNSVEQYQALMDMGFLLVSDDQLQDSDNTNSEQNLILGNNITNSIIGSSDDDLILTLDLTDNVAEYVITNGGQDTLAFDNQYKIGQDDAQNHHAHIRVKDFVIADTEVNQEADLLDLTALLPSNVDKETIGDHIHIVSGYWNDSRTAIFIDADGTFSEEERAALDNDPRSGGQGADLFIEFLGQAANNNFEQITGHADNSSEQIQSLIDMGFLKVQPTTEEPDGGLIVIGPDPDDIFPPIDIIEPPLDFEPVTPPGSETPSDPVLGGEIPPGEILPPSAIIPPEDVLPPVDVILPEEPVDSMTQVDSSSSGADFVEEIPVYVDNSSEQIQSLIDMNFMDVA